MAPNGKPQSYVMQQQQALLQPVMSDNDSSIQVKKECILFSQSVMNGWTPVSGTATTQMSQPTNTDGPEPRILSKKRRDLINAEIRELQNLLPLKKSSRERLSYLGILALTNTFIRKATFFKKECIGSGINPSAGLVSDFGNSLSGFLLVFNREGKILFSSDNILDYLGHTVVELASQGDSIYEIIDKEDHEMIRSQLELQPQTESGEARRLSFFCRMSTSRYMKTQMRSWKNKIVRITGKYHKPEMSNDWTDTAFFAVCEPVESKPVTDVRHHPTPRPTEFKAVHSSDMKFLEVPKNMTTLLGYEPEELVNTSWYQWVFPEDLDQARQQHMKFVKEDGSSFACVIRMIHKNGDLVWVDITAEKSQEAIANSFICNYIAIDEDEVPFYRLHHNLLPFPDHYSEMKRHFLASNSSLLAAALNSDVGLASPSGLTSPTGRHLQSPGSSVPHLLMTPQGFLADNMDTKQLLRRQLKRKLGQSVDGSLGAGSYATGMEIFNLPPPNKMMMRRHTAGDLLYPSAPTGMYPAIHPTYHDAIHSGMYMPPPLFNDAAVLVHPEHHYRSEYASIGQRSVDPSMSVGSYVSGSPRTMESPMLRQSNQNNNVCMNNMYSTPQTIPPQSSPTHSPAYELSSMNPTKTSPMCSPPRCDVIAAPSPTDSYYCDANNNIVDCSGAPMTSCAMSSPVSSHGNYSPAHSGYGGPAQNECVTSVPVDVALGNLITSYEKQFEEEQQMSTMTQAGYTGCSMATSPSSRCQTSPQQQQYSPHYEYQAHSPQKSPMDLTHFDTTSYPRRTSHGSTSPPHDINPDSKPYLLQYSVSPLPPRSGFNSRRYANGERGAEWMRKYNDMTPMEMLLSDSESHSSFYG